MNEINVEKPIKENYFWNKVYPYLFIILFLMGSYLTGFKFIQLGIPDLGLSYCGLNESAVNFYMALMAIIASVVCIIFSIIINKKKLELSKLMILMLIGIVPQGILVMISLYMNQPIHFIIWIILFSLFLGILLPVPFTMLFYLIPKERRGLVAALITGLAYLVGNLSPLEWNAESLVLESSLASGPGLLLLLLGLFNVKKINIINDKEFQAVNYNPKFKIPFYIPVLLMFGVYFVDSFGFLRVIHEDAILTQTWNGPYEIKILFGITHFISALVVGVLYQKYSYRIVFLISFIGFIFGDFLFASYPTDSLLIITSMVYCSTVSAYTINAMVIWADFSDENTIFKNAGIGIAVGGWLSSFVSTAVTAEMFTSLPGVNGFATHLIISGFIATIFLIIDVYLLQKHENSII